MHSTLVPRLLHLCKSAMPRHLLSCRAAVVLLSFLLTPLAAAQPWPICRDKGNFTANSTYQVNLRLLSSTVPKNASASPTLFATATVGTSPDTVYTLVLCRGDTDASSCRTCAATAFQDAQQLCPYRKDVAIYYDLCYLRFSNQNFLVSSDDEVRYVRGRQSVSAAFDDAVGILLNATADYAAANSSKRLGTGEEGFDGSNPKIYALVQCRPDLAAGDCRSCLGGLIQVMPKYLGRITSGRFIGLRCNYRYEVYPFFSGEPLLKLPAPASVGPPPASVGPPPEPDPVPVDVTPPATRGGRKRRAAGISAGVVCCIVLILILSVYASIRLKRRKASKNPHALKKIGRGKCMNFDLPTLQEATENFSKKNKLGEGGFGTVYKGKLSDGLEIAVKKLSESTAQGLNQLFNEVQVLTELQHKKLVRLLGFCSHQNEMMLVYEYIKNGSLDNFLFDNSRGKTLNWEQRYNIVLGIAKGILYLHEDSSIRIIHRDLKPNNVLLDEDMNPKIADFGLARLLEGGHTQTKTDKVVGTYGYMPPEYVIHGCVSPKIDIFSFGVLVLEIVTGRRNSSSEDPHNVINLLSDVWNCWTKGKVLQLIDPSLDRYSKSQVLRCIHISLLCVERDPNDRPGISSVVLMLTRDKMKIQSPVKPAFFFGSGSPSVTQQHEQCKRMYDQSDKIFEEKFSVNEVTITDPDPR